MSSENVRYHRVRSSAFVFFVFSWLCVGSGNEARLDLTRAVTATARLVLADYFPPLP